MLTISQQAYQQAFGQAVLDKAGRYTNTLLAGPSGVGKTTLCKQWPKPILIDSFDPGGTSCFKELIESGDAVADTRYELDNKTDLRPPVPAYMTWQKTHEYRLKQDLFRCFGTYVIDGLTGFGNSLEAAILRKEGRMLPESVALDEKRHGMRMQDWRTFRAFLQSKIFECLSLPCHFVLTCHLNADKDEVTGGYIITPNVSGRSKFELPGLFDNVWYLFTSKDHERRLLLNSDDKHSAQTRAPLDKFVPGYETTNVDVLGWLEKAGYAIGPQGKLEIEKEEVKEDKVASIITQTQQQQGAN